MPTTNDQWPTGTPCWSDCSFDPEHRGEHHTRDFYAHLFGWYVEDDDEGDYLLALKDELPVAALTPVTDGDQVNEWVVYIAADDLDAAAAAVTAAGGQVAAGPSEIPGFGRVAYCLDPQGASFALWHGIEHLGYGLVGEPGTVGWHSLLTSDVVAAQQFYARVFGWSYDDAGNALRSDGTPVAKVEPCDEVATTPMWTPHFAVADRDSSAQIAQELGGHILRRTETEWGKEAWLEGPGGERFQIVATDAA